MSDDRVTVRISQPEQRVAESDLAAFAAPAPTPASVAYAPAVASTGFFTEDELARATIDILSGRPIYGRTPEERRMLEQLKAEIDALPPQAVVDVPAPIQGTR